MTPMAQADAGPLYIYGSKTKNKEQARSNHDTNFSQSVPFRW